MIQTWNLIQSPPGFLEQGTKSISGNTKFVALEEAHCKETEVGVHFQWFNGKAYLKYEIGAFSRAP